MPQDEIPDACRPEPFVAIIRLNSSTLFRSRDYGLYCPHPHRSLQTAALVPCKGFPNLQASLPSCVR